MPLDKKADISQNCQQHPRTEKDSGSWRERVCPKRIPWFFKAKTMHNKQDREQTYRFAPNSRWFAPSP